MAILFFFYLSWILSSSLASSSSVDYLPLKAASLGNWLVTEGWMEPSMFSGIENNDLLDGTQVRFMSTRLRKYIAVENDGKMVVANSSSGSTWQTFRLWRINETFFNFRVINKQFIGLENEGLGNKLVAVSETANFPETFQIIRKEDNPNQVRIRASNGLFIQAESEKEMTADYDYRESTWEENDPSVFNMTVVSTMQGEYQITNGYGPEKAPKFMRDHWKTYITEDDFEFMSENGLNAVRIPVGWWIAYDPTPPKPFVGGSLQALDNAFIWAEKYGMKVIVDLHAVRVSQNGYPHSASRDGFQEWTASDIPETAAIIDFLASRYANHSSLAAIELMNEPLAPGLALESLKEYYKQGYDTVRKYTSDAYVILSNRLGARWTELLSFASNLTRVAIDVHYYNLFSDNFNGMSVQQNIDYVRYSRSSNLREITTSNSSLSFVGEWTNEWHVRGATKEDFQRFAKIQLDVYGRATFGWAYWAYKCHSHHWNLRWMIENNYIEL